MSFCDHEYIDLLDRVILTGERREDRTGTGTRSLFGQHVTVSRDVTQWFPIVEAKKTQFRSVILELLWMLRQETSTRTLDCGIWDAWADEGGELGPVYGAQWRGWRHVEKVPPPFQFSVQERRTDQIAQLVAGLKNNPTSRRHIVSAWNVGELDQMALVPCHYAFQCYVSQGKYLDMQVNQRSADLGLGVPFNWASYALLMLMLAKETGLYARELKFAYGDVHVYENHLEKLRELISRQSTHFERPHPVVELADGKRIPLLDPNPEAWYTLDDIELKNYNPGPFIKLPVAV